MSFTRRKFLVSGVAAAAGGALVSRGAGAKSAQVPSQLIIVLTRGGWDPTFVFEPRLGDDFVEGPEVDEDPDNSEDIEALRTFGEVTLAVNDFKRPAVTTFFEKWMPRSAIVNGIWTGAIAHAPSMIRMLTGTISTANPDFGAIIGHKMGADLPLGYIDLAGSAFPGKLAA